MLIVRLKTPYQWLSQRRNPKVFDSCMVTKDLTGKDHTGNIIKELTPLVGCGDGVLPDMARSGGTGPEKPDAMFPGPEKPSIA